MQDSINVIWHYSTVKQIQARLVAILQASVHWNFGQTGRAQPTERPIPKPLSCTGEILATRHSFLSFSKTLYCTKCLCRAPVAASERRTFINSQCVPDRALLRTMALGSTKPTRVPAGEAVTIGKSQLHSTHSLSVFKGLFFCTSCGYHGSAKAQKLTLECTDRSHTAKMRVVRLLHGKLP